MTQPERVVVTCPKCGISRPLIVYTVRKPGFTGLCNRCKNYESGVVRVKSTKARKESKTIRQCLKCGVDFRSDGIHNRLCPKHGLKNHGVGDM
jgi:RNase P subunit RPR2